MSDENRDSTTGQFAPAEPAFGKEGVEREAGYVPFKEDAADDGELTVAEAAEKLTEVQGTPEGSIKTYSALDGLPENVTLTPEQAGKLLADDRAAENDADEAVELERVRNEADELRRAKPEAKAEAEPETQPVKEGELDPEIERALSNPKIQAALSQHVAETESVRQQYAHNIEAATQIAQATFMSQFPEFAHIPAENLGAAIQAMQQQDPARAAQIAAVIQRTLPIFEQQKAMHQYEAQEKQAKFSEYVKTENAKFDALVKSETPETMKAIPAAIKDALTEYGVDLGEFGRLLASSELVNHSAVQRLLVDAGKYRLITQAPKAVAAKNLPSVQRPGVSRSASERGSEDLRALTQKFTQTGNMKDAVALRAAQQKSRARNG